MSSRSAEKTDIESRLRGASESITDRMEALQEEVATTNVSVRQWARDNPVWSVGAAVVAGCAVGWLMSGARRRRRQRTHDRLLDRYSQALTREVEAALADGTEPSEAVQDALRNRVPLVVFTANDSPRTSSSQRGILRETVGAILTTLVAEIIRGGVGNVADQLGGGLGDELDALFEALDEPPKE